MEKEQQTDILIIGAGIAGLYTAYLLINEGYKVSILEASPTYGGRIKSLTGFAPIPIELGAEYIHGKNSILYELVDYFNEEIIPIKDKSYIWWQEQLLTEKQAIKNKEIAAAFDFMDNSWRYQGDEIEVDNYLKEQAFYKNTSQILEVFGMEYGTTNNYLGLKSLAKAEEMWTSGDEHYKLKTPMINILREFIDCASPYIAYNQAVNHIDYSQEDTIKIRTAKEKIYEAKYVVCTVPLTMLKNNSIEFLPELPINKKKALESLGMDAGAKVFLKFKKRFWRKNMWELFGTSSSPLYYQLFPQNHAEHSILVAYLMGDFAESFSAKGNQAVTDLVLELDLVFGNQVASKNFEDAFIMDWKKEPYIGGAYSYDAPYSDGKRRSLAESIDNRLFFGGEATNYTGHAATMHGAMETGDRCYKEIKKIFKPLI